MDTLKLRREGAVVIAEIDAPPMNLEGPELVRDLVSLIQPSEADDTLRVLGEYVSQVSAIGPLGLHYLNSQDDPRNGPGAQ